MFQWNDDRCNTTQNFICKYSDDKPSTTPSLSPGGEATEPAAPIRPEETLEIDTKERREAALNLAYILIPSIPLVLLLA
ncbi:hypothetical protein OFC51_32620, partial [Escherichia coli]|nr:hypothetical protein [Escherichia coli]